MKHIATITKRIHETVYLSDVTVSHVMGQFLTDPYALG